MRPPRQVIAFVLIVFLASLGLLLQLVNHLHTVSKRLWFSNSSKRSNQSPSSQLLVILQELTERQPLKELNISRSKNVSSHSAVNASRKTESQMQERSAENQTQCQVLSRKIRSDWFCSIYDESQRVLLNSRSLAKPINKAVLDYLKNIYPTLRAGLDKGNSLVEFMKQIVSSGEVPSEDVFESWRQSKGNLTCAVVGNSDILSGSNKGQLIDSHEVVFRFNNYETKGYEKDVGNKTTFQNLYRRIAKYYKPPSRVIVITQALVELTWVENVHKVGIDKKKVLLLHPDFIYLVRTWLKSVDSSYKNIPSSGIYTLLLALYVCDEVSIFGFGVNGSYYGHYYGVRGKVSRVPLRQTSYHMWDTEKMLRDRLQTVGVIKVYQ
eukprot:m.178569 g.178569  ORF g.178569 m.178569 type:complete len:380 (+) comp39179_c0_seq25:26-1165(+)